MQEKYPWAVYHLKDETGAIRYVGITKQPKRRLGGHLREARAGGRARRSAWVRSLLTRGVKPTFEIVEWTSDWDEAERRWVRQCKADGCDLVNATAGGKDFSPAQAKSGSYPQIKYMRNLMGMMLADLKSKRYGSLNPALIARCEYAHEAFRQKLKRTRKQGPEAMQALEMLCRARVRLAPGLRHGAA